jgi:hypothetical protein
MNEKDVLRVPKLRHSVRRRALVVLMAD